jgi:hypothetical protein
VEQGHQPFDLGVVARRLIGQRAKSSQPRTLPRRDQTSEYGEAFAFLLIRLVDLRLEGQSWLDPLQATTTCSIAKEGQPSFDRPRQGGHR